jgi:SAM-dependent methyltransferase
LRQAPSVRGAETKNSLLAQVSSVAFSAREGEPSPLGYYGPLVAKDPQAQAAAVARECRYYRDLFRFARVAPAGCDVLEVGSGFGLGLLLVAELGVRSAHGVELVPWMVDYARRAAQAAAVDNVVFDVGDATCLPIPDASVDLVLSLEAVSHYLDYEPFLGEARRVLRPGGKLLISDGNNGLNPWIRRKTHALWAQHEQDVETADHPWTFVPKRERIIRERHPTLRPEVAHRLALHTSGMVRAEIERAADRFVQEGVEPARPYRRGTLSVHPEHEMVMERLFNPYRLARELRGHGFETRVRGHWAGASGKPALRALDRVLGVCSPLTIPSARAFRIVAVKR